MSGGTGSSRLYHVLVFFLNRFAFFCSTKIYERVPEAVDKCPLPCPALMVKALTVLPSPHEPLAACVRGCHAADRSLCVTRSLQGQHTPEPGVPGNDVGQERGNDGIDPRIDLCSGFCEQLGSCSVLLINPCSSFVIATVGSKCSCTADTAVA